MEELLLERRQRPQPLGVNATPDPPPQRGWGVLTEVEAVPPVDAFEQELELDLIEVVTRRRLLDRKRQQCLCQGCRRGSGSRAPSQRPHWAAARLVRLGKAQGGLWRRVMAGQRPTCT